MKNRLPVLVYLVGMLPLGYWQQPLRDWLGDWRAFAVVIVYLLFLRLLGSALVKIWEYKQARDTRMHNLAIETRKKGGV